MLLYIALDRQKLIEAPNLPASLFLKMLSDEAVTLYVRMCLCPYSTSLIIGEPVKIVRVAITIEADLAVLG